MKGEIFNYCKIFSFNNVINYKFRDNSQTLVNESEQKKKN